MTKKQATTKKQTDKQTAPNLGVKVENGLELRHTRETIIEWIAFGQELKHSDPRHYDQLHENLRQLVKSGKSLNSIRLIQMRYELRDALGFEPLSGMDPLADEDYSRRIMEDRRKEWQRVRG